jgi:AraC-like DNA-binding protein
MSTRLNCVEDWTAVAIACAFQLGKMAKAVGVSERTLRRHVKKHFGIPAKEWRDTKRLEIALSSLSCGDQVKSTTGNAKFMHREALSAFIKRQTGSSPRHFSSAKLKLRFGYPYP